MRKPLKRRLKPWQTRPRPDGLLSSRALTVVMAATRTVRVLVIGLLAVLAACADSGPAPVVWQVDAFKLPAESPAGSFRIQDKSIVHVPEDLSTLSEGERPMVATMAGQGIQGSAYWRYWLPEEEGRGFYKLKVTVFDSEDAAAAAWDRRYPPEALDGTQPLEVGQTGFLLPGRIAGFRLQRLMTEIEAGGLAKALESFVDHYAAFAREQAARR